MKKVKAMWIGLSSIVVVILVLVITYYVIMSKFDYWHPILTKYKLASYVKEEVVEGQVVFLGDSITDNCDLNKFYSDIKTYNRGISGDRTIDVLTRMDGVYSLKPQVVVLLIGVNDIIFFDRKTEDIVTDYKAIVDGIKANCEGVQILCQSLYPTLNVKKDNYGNFNEKITLLNNEIIKLCNDTDNSDFIDIRPVISQDNGELKADFSKDGLHPNDAAYELISNFLSPYIKEKLN